MFRVDNPHTSRSCVLEPLITTTKRGGPGRVLPRRGVHPPRMMQALAMVGFQQSYSYFTWRNTKAEPRNSSPGLAGHRRLHAAELFVNTPDILPSTWSSGAGGFMVRATIAATAAPIWGVTRASSCSSRSPGRCRTGDHRREVRVQATRLAAAEHGASRWPCTRDPNRIRADLRRSASSALRFHPSEDDSCSSARRTSKAGSPRRRGRHSSATANVFPTPSARRPWTSTSPRSVTRPRHDLRGRRPGHRYGLGMAMRRIRATRRVHPARAHHAHEAGLHARTSRRTRHRRRRARGSRRGPSFDPHPVLGQHGFDIAGARSVHGDPHASPARRLGRRLLDDDRPLPTPRRARHLGGGRRPRSVRPPHPREVRADPNGQCRPLPLRTTIGEPRLHLIGEGRHEELWKAGRPLPRPLGDAPGGSRHRFTVWAPRRAPCASWASSTAGTAPATPCDMGPRRPGTVVPTSSRAALQVRDTHRSGEWPMKANPWR